MTKTKIYCDNIETLELFLNKNDIKEPFTVVSASPAMLNQSKYNCISPEPAFPMDKRLSYINSLSEVTQKVFLEVNDYSKNSSIAIFCTQFFFRLQKSLLYTMAFEASDFTDPRYVLITIPSGDQSHRPPFKTLLSPNPHLVVQTYSIESRRKHRKVSLWERIQFAGISDFIFRFLITFEKYSPFKKYFLVFSENELLKDTALELFKRGYGYRKIPTAVHFKPEIILDHNLWKILERHILARYSEYTDNNNIQNVIPGMKDAFESDLYKFNAHTVFYDSFLKTTSGAVAVLTNAPGSTYRGCALHNACKMNSIPLASFQHGVSKEISKSHREMWCFYDGNISDITFVFNEEAKRRTLETAPFKGATVFVVGTPQSYSRKTKKIQLSEELKQKSVFLSTCLYRAYDGTFMGTKTDMERFKAEVFLINNVLAKSNDSYIYKTYPIYTMRRFGYDNPIHDLSDKYSNIEFYSDDVDIRYFVENFKLIITSRSTSTFSWALLSGLPIVFINHDDEYAIFDSMKEQIKKSVFYFEFNDSDFVSTIVEFLNLPYQEKLRLWRNMELEREKFIGQYISSNRFHAGKNAAQHIIAYAESHKSP